MAHHSPRPRRDVSPPKIRILKLLGFRYSAGRDAYVLRVVGNRFGPVFRTSIEAPAFSETPAPPDPSETTHVA